VCAKQNDGDRDLELVVEEARTALSR
jgi:hypothetical protein